MSVQIGVPRLQLNNARLIRIADESLESCARVNTEQAQVDPRCNDPQTRPVNAVFVVAYEIFCEIDYFEQVIWFNRADDCDELWSTSGAFTTLRTRLPVLSPDESAGYIDDCCHQCARVFSVPRSGSFDESLIELLSCYFATAAGAPCGVDHLIASGYISQVQFGLLFQRMLRDQARLEREHEDWTRLALRNQTGIIHAARELGLNPKPAGIGPVQWYARCPGKSHRLMITTGHDQFGCGYCKVKGGIAELRTFVARQIKHVHLE